jgi:hypothetical protein
LSHPLHLAIAEAIEQQLNDRCALIRDTACGGNQQLPLFIGPRKGKDTRMCCVDLLVVSSGRVRVIIEIEESGFHPTKICGKFLQSAFATHFIHDSRAEVVLPYGDEVLFVQVLDGSEILKPGTRKDAQAELIGQQIRKLLPLMKSRVSDYQLFFVSRASDEAGLATVGVAVSAAFT